jgi:hypothetical protein
MSCGTDDNDDLTAGNFNEADSHRWVASRAPSAVSKFH